MEYLYHRVPPHMEGTILYPLNQLKDIHPKLYAQEVKKYEGRERLLLAEVQPLHCLWNDVLHMTAVSPDEVRVGMQVQVQIEKRADRVALPVFVPRAA